MYAPSNAPYCTSLFCASLPFFVCATIVSVCLLIAILGKREIFVHQLHNIRARTSQVTAELYATFRRNLHALGAAWQRSVHLLDTTFRRHLRQIYPSPRTRRQLKLISFPLVYTWLIARSITTMVAAFVARQAERVKNHLAACALHQYDEAALQVETYGRVSAVR